MASWHCHSPGTTNAGAICPDAALPQNDCLSHSATQGPLRWSLHLIFQSPTAVAIMFWTRKTRCGDYSLAAGEKCLTDPLSLRRLLGMQLALLKKAELFQCSFFAQVSQGVQEAANLGPASIFNLQKWLQECRVSALPLYSKNEVSWSKSISQFLWGGLFKGSMNYTLKKPRVCELLFFFFDKTFLLAYLRTMQLLTCWKCFSV